MKDYTTGRAARELRVSQNRLRALCQAGMIAARATPGGHFRIPKSEIDRLRRDGVPDPPPATPVEPQAEPVSVTAANPHRHPVLLAEPSEQAISSADEVVRLENEVKAIGLRRTKEETLDWFRDRQRKQDEAKAAQTREVLQANAQRLHREWENTWLEFAIEGLPDDAPEDGRLPIYESVRQALADLSPSDPEEIVEPLVRAAMERGLLPWRHSKKIEEAIQDARNQLPGWTKSWAKDFPSEWELRAMRVAREAIGQLRNDATLHEIRAAGIAAGGQVAQELAYRETCRGIVECIYLPYALNEQEKARQAVREALEILPTGTPRATLERVRNDVLAPFKTAQETARIQAHAASQADIFLLHVDSYLSIIAADLHSELDFGNFSDRYQFAQELKREIRPILIEEILDEPLNLNEAHTFIESLVEHRLAR